jgi:NADPH:quinone reductase-like Zn-dependent oxidoreductase
LPEDLNLVIILISNELYFLNFQLKPLIDSVFTFDQLKEAYYKLKAGHARGKIVIEMV